VRERLGSSVLRSEPEVGSAREERQGAVVRFPFLLPRAFDFVDEVVLAVWVFDFFFFITAPKSLVAV
jgi:hypothetical protein